MANQDDPFGINDLFDFSKSSTPSLVSGYKPRDPMAEMAALVKERNTMDVLRSKQVEAQNRAAFDNELADKAMNFDAYKENAIANIENKTGVKLIGKARTEFADGLYDEMYKSLKSDKRYAPLREHFTANTLKPSDMEALQASALKEKAKADEKSSDGYFSEISSGFGKGWDTLTLGTKIQAGTNNKSIAEDIALSNKEKPSAEKKKFQTELGDVALEFDKDPTIGNALSVAGKLVSNPKYTAGMLAESMGSSIVPSLASMFAGSKIGALAGGAGGALIGGVGAIPGAAAGGVVGGITGLAGGNVETNILIEAGGKLQKLIAEKYPKIDMSDSKQVEQALILNPSLKDEALAYANKKGVATGLTETAIDVATLGVGKALKTAKGLAANAAPSRLGNATKYAGAVGMQGVGEAAGSVAGSLAVDEKINKGEVLTEGLLGAAGGIADIGAINRVIGGKSSSNAPLRPDATFETDNQPITLTPQQRADLRAMPQEEAFTAYATTTGADLNDPEVYSAVLQEFEALRAEPTIQDGVAKGITAEVLSGYDEKTSPIRALKTTLTGVDKNTLFDGLTVGEDNDAATISAKVDDALGFISSAVSGKGNFSNYTEPEFVQILADKISYVEQVNAAIAADEALQAVTGEPTRTSAAKKVVVDADNATKATQVADAQKTAAETKAAKEAEILAKKQADEEARVSAIEAKQDAIAAKKQAIQDAKDLASKTAAEKKMSAQTKKEQDAAEVVGTRFIKTESQADAHDRLRTYSEVSGKPLADVVAKHAEDYVKKTGRTGQGGVKIEFQKDTLDVLNGAKETKPNYADALELGLSKDEAGAVAGIRKANESERDFQPRAKKAKAKYDTAIEKQGSAGNQMGKPQAAQQVSQLQTMTTEQIQQELQSLKQNSKEGAPNETKTTEGGQPIVETAPAVDAKLPEKVNANNTRANANRTDAGVDANVSSAVPTGMPIPDTNVQPNAGGDAVVAGGAEAVRPAKADLAPKDKPVTEVNISDLKLSKDLPQFKDGANENGVVSKLEGKFDRALAAPIQVWRRKNGDLEVISGRHRLDLAKRSGEQSVPAQINNESDGFTLADAQVLDIILNVKDGRGKTTDYIKYFKELSISDSAAKEDGLLQTAIGRDAFTIATKGSDETAGAAINGQIGITHAVSISQAAPNDSALQAVGLKYALKGESADKAANMIKAVASMGGVRDTTGDMFGFDDSGLKEAEAIATEATKRQRDISRQIAAVQGAAKNPVAAKALGVNVKDANAVLKKIEELKAQQDALSRFETDSELVADLRKSAGLEPSQQSQEVAEAEPEALVLEPTTPEGDRANAARAANATALDAQQQAIAENQAQPLVQQTAPDQRTDNTSDMFALEKAQAEIDKANEGRTVEVDPNQGAMFNTPDSQYNVQNGQSNGSPLGAQLSQSPTTTNPSNPAAIRSAIEGIFSGMKDAWARVSKSTEIINSDDITADMIPVDDKKSRESAQAFYQQSTGKIYLIADRIEKGTEASVWLHEVFHKRGEELLGKENLKKLYDNVQSWKTRKPDSVERQIYEAANKRATDSGEYDTEFLTYAIEEANNRGVTPDASKGTITAAGWLAKVKSLFTNALRKLLSGYAGKMDISANDLMAMAYGAAKLEYEGKTDGAQGDGVLATSLTPFDGIEKARTPLGDTKTVTVDGKEYSVFNSDGKPIHGTVEGVRNFIRWFGDSKVIDADGKPLVVYHGTNQDFAEFDREQSREGDGIVFATPSQRVASDFAKYRTVWGGANVMPIYVKADKMLEVQGDGRDIRDVERDAKFDGMKYGETVRDFAAREGYDAIVFRQVRDPVSPDIDPISDIYALLPSAQIKSATGNNGNFDASNPDIRYSNSKSSVLSKNGKFKGWPMLAFSRVWHGSQHKFLQFDSSKIGTGEGAQAYGHGLYLAESKGVAGSYQESLSTDPERFLVDGKEVFRRQANGPAFDVSDPKTAAIFYAARKGDKAAREYFAEQGAWGGKAIAELDAMKGKAISRVAPGNLYQVDLPDDQIAKMLDWDKPLSEQPQIRGMIQKDLEDILSTDRNEMPWTYGKKADDMTGEDLVRSFASIRGTYAGASDLLKEGGIPGIRYLDRGSRGNGAGTSNYVIFPGMEKILTIIDVNGEPVTGAEKAKVLGDQMDMAFSRGTNEAMTNNDVVGNQGGRSADDYQPGTVKFNSFDNDERARDRLSRIQDVEEEYRLPNIHQAVPKDYVPKEASQKTVTIYRGVPTSVKDASIRPGDWVGLSKKYAADHGTGETGRSKVISIDVPADHVVWAGTDMNEWFYAPRQPNESTPTRNPTNEANIRSAIEGIFSGMKDAWARISKSTVVIESDDITADMIPVDDKKSRESAQAFYQQSTGKIYLIADRIEKGTEASVWLHEVFHKRGEELLGKENLKKLYDNVQSWKTRKPDSVERQIYEAANKRATDSGEYDTEFLTYAIEEANNRGVTPDASKGTITAAGWLAKVKSLFINALRKLLGGYAGNIDLSANDLMAMAYGAAKLEYEGKTAGAQGDGIQFSLSDDVAKKVDKVVANAQKAIDSAKTGAQRVAALRTNDPAVKTALLARFSQMSDIGRAAYIKVLDQYAVSSLFKDYFKNPKGDYISQVADLVSMKSAEVAKNMARFNTDLMEKIDNTVDRAALEDVMDKATFIQYDPSGNTRKKTIATTAEEKALKAQYEKLSPQAKQVYRDILRSNRDQFRRLILAVGKTMDELGVDTAQSKALQEKMKLGQIDVYFAQNHGDGNYVVFATEKGKADHVFFRRYESKAEAEAEKAALAKENPSWTVSDVTAYQDLKKPIFNASTEDMLARFEARLKRDGKSDAEVSDAVQSMRDVISSAMVTKTEAMLRTRKNIAGARKDIKYTIRSFTAMESLIAKVKHQHKINKTIADAQKHIEANDGKKGYDKVAAQQALDAIRASVNFASDKGLGSQIADKINMVGYLTTIAANISSPLVNLTSLTNLALPDLGAKYGFAKAAKMMLVTAFKDVQANFTKQISEMTGDLKIVAEHAEKMNRDHFSNAKEMLDLANNTSPTMSKVMYFSGWMQSQSERAVNLQVMLTAYKLEMDRSGDQEKALAESIRAVNKGNPSNAAITRGAFAKSNIGRVVLMLKTYQINVLVQMVSQVSTVWKAAKDSGDPVKMEEARVAGKNLAGILIMHGITAGVIGLPYAVMVTLGAALQGAFGDEEDKNKPYDEWLKDFFYKHLGKENGSTLFYGILGAGISKRIGIGDLIFQERFAGRNEHEYVTDYVLQALGAGVSNINEIVKTISTWNKEREVMPADVANERAIKRLPMPAVSNILKWLQFQEDGGIAYTKDGTPLNTDENRLTGVDMLLQAIGFRPSTVAEATADRNAAYKVVTVVKAERAALLKAYKDMQNQLLRGVGSEEHVAEVEALIDAFNERFPAYEITEKSIKTADKKVKQQLSSVIADFNDKDEALVDESKPWIFPK